MPKFNYKAVNDEGENIEGILEAGSMREVIAKILISRHYPTQIEELSQQSLVQHQRLDSLKRIRNLFNPPTEAVPTIVTLPRAKRLNKITLIIVIAAIAWILMLVIYLTSTT